MHGYSGLLRSEGARKAALPIRDPSDVYSYGIVVWEVTTALGFASPHNAQPVRPRTRHLPWEGCSADETQGWVSVNDCSYAFSLRALTSSLRLLGLRNRVSTAVHPTVA